MCAHEGLDSRRIDTISEQDPCQYQNCEDINKTIGTRAVSKKTRRHRERGIMKVEYLTKGESFSSKKYRRQPVDLVTYEVPIWYETSMEELLT